MVDGDDLPLGAALRAATGRQDRAATRRRAAPNAALRLSITSARALHQRRPHNLPHAWDWHGVPGSGLGALCRARQLLTFVLTWAQAMDDPTAVAAVPAHAELPLELLELIGAHLPLPPTEITTRFKATQGIIWVEPGCGPTW